MEEEVCKRKEQHHQEQSQITQKNGWVKEVDNLIWLSNVVLANKAWSDHRMCIDFTNVNFATPKYCFYIPNIDQLVDDIPGFKVIYFMDAC